MLIKDLEPGTIFVIICGISSNNIYLKLPRGTFGNAHTRPGARDLPQYVNIKTGYPDWSEDCEVRVLGTLHSIKCELPQPKIEEYFPY